MSSPRSSLYSCHGFSCYDTSANSSSTWLPSSVDARNPTMFDCGAISALNGTILGKNENEEKFLTAENPQNEWIYIFAQECIRETGFIPQNLAHQFDQTDNKQ